MASHGLRGIVARIGGELRRYPAYQVEAVDTTGAGDAFVGCLATVFGETGDLENAIATANRYAALSTTRPGTQKSFMDRSEFESIA